MQSFTKNLQTNADPNLQAKCIQIYFMDPQDGVELGILHNDGI